MFSSRAPKLIGAALMDLAEAMLRPVDDGQPENTPHPGAARSVAQRPGLAQSGATRRDIARSGVTRPPEQLAPQIDDWLLESAHAAPLESSAARRAAARRAATRREPRAGERTVARLEPHAGEQRRRRGGAIERTAQPCTSPLPAKPAAPHSR